MQYLMQYQVFLKLFFQEAEEDVEINYRQLLTVGHLHFPGL